VPESTRVEDDHLPFLAAGVPSVDIIDLDYEPWHTAKDTLDAVSARSLQVVGDVVLAALPQIETRFTKGLTLTGRRLRPRRPYVLTAVHHRMRKGHRSRRGLNGETAGVAH
jgi:Peptidase family M28